MNSIRQSLNSSSIGMKQLDQYQQSLGFDYVLTPLQFRESQLNQDQINKLQLMYDDSDAIKGQLKIIKQIQDQESNYLRFIPIFNPNSYGMLIWKFLQGVVIVVIFYEIPIYISFGADVWNLLEFQQFDILLITIVIILGIDLLIEFCTAYYEQGNIIMDSKKIALNYYYNYLIFDLIAYVTFSIRCFSFTNKFRMVYTFFYFKWPQLEKINLLFDEVTLLHRALRTMYAFAKILIFLQFCFLLFACGFYLIGYASVQAGLNSWLLNNGNFGVIDIRTIESQSFFSYYMSLGTMTTLMGYGDITPLNIYECTFCLGGIVFACFVYQVNINSLYKIMDQYNMVRLKIFRFRVSINRLMKAMNVPLPVQQRVRQFLNEHWFIDASRDLDVEKQIFNSLAPHLKQELFLNSYGVFLQNYFMFQQFSQGAIRALALKVIELRVSNKEQIFMELDDYSVYYIKSGQINIYINDKLILNLLTDGQIFGEYSFFTGLGRQAKAEAKAYTMLFKLSRQDCLDVLSQFQDDLELFYSLKEELTYNNFKSINTQCWNCHKSNHYSLQCDVTSYKPVLNDLIISKTYQQEQDRNKYNRKKKKSKIINIKHIQSKIQQNVLKGQKLTVIKESLTNFERPYNYKKYYPEYNFQQHNQTQQKQQSKQSIITQKLYLKFDDQ